jgi:hypothetical protein
VSAISWKEAKGNENGKTIRLTLLHMFHARSYCETQLLMLFAEIYESYFFNGRIMR